MLEIQKYGEFKPTGKQKKKHQIILSHSCRKSENYLFSLKYRFNGKHPRIPNYFIDKSGRIFKLL